VLSALAYGLRPTCYCYLLLLLPGLALPVALLGFGLGSGLLATGYWVLRGGIFYIWSAGCAVHEVTSNEVATNAGRGARSRMPPSPSAVVQPRPRAQSGASASQRLHLRRLHLHRLLLLLLLCRWV
jgi:hypothetical protein